MPQPSLTSKNLASASELSDQPPTLTLTEADIEAILSHRSGACWIGDWSNGSLLTLSGSDAVSFLQNRCTNDVASLTSGQGCANAVLNKSAQIQAVFSTHCWQETLWLMTETTQDEALFQHLKRYHILEDITLTPKPDMALVAIQGIEAARILADVFGSDVALHLAGLREWGITEVQENQSTSPQKQISTIASWIIKQSLTGEPGYLIAVAQEQKETLLTQLSATADRLNIHKIALSDEALSALQIEAGQLRYGVDYNGTTLLPETGLEQNAVSYTKGCYLGQETVARVKTYGSVPRAIVGLQFQPGTLPPQPGATLWAKTDENAAETSLRMIGSLCSVVDSPTLKRPVAIAYLDKSHRTPDQRMTVWIGNQGSDKDNPQESSAPNTATMSVYDLTVTLLPFYTSPVVQEKAQALLRSGLSAFANGEDAEAVQQLREALAIDPTLYDGYEALGVILSRQEKYDEAIALMHQLADAEPERLMAHTNLSVFYMKIGDKEKAEEEKAKATVLGMRLKAKEAGLSFNPEAEALKKAAAAQQRIQMFLDALAFNPTDPLGNFGLASAYVELGDYKNAIEPFRKTLAAQPNYSACYLALGKTYEHLQNTLMAMDTYRNGIEVAAKRRDLMPLQEMQQRLKALEENTPLHG